VHVDLDTLATALYVRIDDEMKASPQLNRWRPAVGIAPRITDAELITTSVIWHNWCTGQPIMRSLTAYDH
jgi:hypothetical protein